MGRRWSTRKGQEVSKRIWKWPAEQGHTLRGVRRKLRQASSKRKARFLAEPTPFGKAWRNRLPCSHELTEQMGDLQEEVKDFGGGGVLSVGVFQRVAPVFLNIEAFILDLPAEPTSLIGESGHVVCGDMEVRHPLEPSGLGLAVDGTAFRGIR